MWRSICLVVALASCKFANEGLIDEAAALEKKACACKDKTCIDGVVKEFAAWFDNHKQAWGTNNQMERLEKHFEKMGTCMGNTGMSDASMAVLQRIAEEAEKL
jgi:hypothetical protein